MMKKVYSIVLSIVVISVFLCSGSFAQDIPIYSGLTCDSEMSQKALQAFETEKQKFFDEYKPELVAFANSLPDPDKKAKILALVDRMEVNLNNLQTMTVCFSSETYEAVHNYYSTQVPGLVLDDVGTNELEIFLTQKLDELEQIAPGPLPEHPIPESTLEELRTLNANGDLKATRGKLGTSRISILSVYLHPETFAVIGETTVVISTFTELL